MASGGSPTSSTRFIADAQRLLQTTSARGGSLPTHGTKVFPEKPAGGPHQGHPTTPVRHDHPAPRSAPAESRRLARRGVGAFSPAFRPVASAPSSKPKIPYGAGGQGRSSRSKQKTSSTPLESIVTESLNWLGIVILGGPRLRLHVGRLCPGAECQGKKQNPDDPPRAKSQPDPRFQRFLLPRKGRLGNNALQRMAFDHPGAAPESLGGSRFSSQHRADWIIVQPQHGGHSSARPRPRSAAQSRPHVPRAKCRCDDHLRDHAVTACAARSIAGMDGPGKWPICSKTRSRVPPLAPPSRSSSPICVARHGEARIAAAGGYLAVNETCPASGDPLQLAHRPVHQGTAPVDRVLLLVPEADLQKLARELRSIGIMPKNGFRDGPPHRPRNRYNLSPHTRRILPYRGRRPPSFAVIEEMLGAEVSGGRSKTARPQIGPPKTNVVGNFAKILEMTRLGLRTQAAGRCRCLRGAGHQQVQKLRSHDSSARNFRRPQPLRASISRGPTPQWSAPTSSPCSTFAREHELEAEILYVKKNDCEVRLTIHPKGFEGIAPLRPLLGKPRQTACTPSTASSGPSFCSKPPYHRPLADGAPGANCLRYPPSSPSSAACTPMPVFSVALTSRLAKDRGGRHEKARPRA